MQGDWEVKFPSPTANTVLLHLYAEETIDYVAVKMAHFVYICASHQLTESDF